MFSISLAKNLVFTFVINFCREYLILCVCVVIYKVDLLENEFFIKKIVRISSIV